MLLKLLIALASAVVGFSLAALGTTLNLRDSFSGTGGFAVVCKKCSKTNVLERCASGSVWVDCPCGNSWSSD